MSFKLKDIIDKPYERKGEIISGRTAVITVWDDRGKETEVERAYIEAETVYGWIDEGRDIILDECYIRDFSLSTYRETRALGIVEPVSLIHFSAEESFFDCLKENNVDFSVAQFGNGDVDFSVAQFGDGDVDFSVAQFGNGNVDFSVAQFGNGNVDFSLAQFGNGKIDFTGTQFGNGDIDFSNTEFGDGNVYFFQTHFKEERISFSDALLIKLSFESLHFNHYVDLRFAKCNTLDLSDTVIRDIVDISPVRFHQFSCLNLRLTGKIYLDWEANNLKNAVENQRIEEWNGETAYIELRPSTHREKAEQFRTLKENFHNIGRYEDEDKAYVEFKRHELRADRKEKKIWIGRYWFRWLVFEKIGDYGTSPFKIFRSMMVTLGIFAGLYLLPWACFDCSKDFAISNLILKKIFTAVYHSIVTFLTIGYGNIYPASPFAVLLSGVEGFMGLFLMSYFTVAFARKVLR